MPTYSKETALYNTGAIADGINEAGQTAESYITTVSGGGIMVHPAGDATSGWKIADALELLKGGMTFIKAWLSGTAPNQTPTIQIGSDDGAHTVIDEDSFSLKNAEQVTMFECESSDVVSEVTVTDNVGKSVVGSGEVSHTLSGNPVSGTTITVNCFGTVGSVYATFTAGTSGSDSSLSGITITYDGDKTIIASFSSANQQGTFASVEYTVEMHEPAMAFGTNRGDLHGFSASIGEGLVTGSRHQLVIGRYNAQSDKAFVIGNGTALHPNDVFWVDWNGNVSAGRINANGYINASGYTVGGNPIIETSTKSASTGSFTGYLNVPITPTVPHNKTLFAVAGIHVTGNGSSNSQLIGFYIDGNDIHVQLKNTSSTSYTWSVEAVGVYM